MKAKKFKSISGTSFESQNYKKLQGNLYKIDDNKRYFTGIAVKN